MPRLPYTRSLHVCERGWLESRYTPAPYLLCNAGLVFILLTCRETDPTIPDKVEAGLCYPYRREFHRQRFLQTDEYRCSKQPDVGSYRVRLGDWTEKESLRTAVNGRDRRA